MQALDTPRLARLSAPGGGAKLPLLAGDGLIIAGVRLESVSRPI